MAEQNKFYIVRNQSFCEVVSFTLLSPICFSGEHIFNSFNTFYIKYICLQHVVTSTKVINYYQPSLFTTLFLKCNLYINFKLKEFSLYNLAYYSFNTNQLFQHIAYFKRDKNILPWFFCEPGAESLDSLDHQKCHSIASLQQITNFMVDLRMEFTVINILMTF